MGIYTIKKNFIFVLFILFFIFIITKPLFSEYIELPYDIYVVSNDLLFNLTITTVGSYQFTGSFINGNLSINTYIPDEKRQLFLKYEDSNLKFTDCLFTCQIDDAYHIYSELWSCDIRPYDLSKTGETTISIIPKLNNVKNGYLNLKKTELYFLLQYIKQMNGKNVKIKIELDNKFVIELQFMRKVFDKLFFTLNRITLM
jgi:hypothetical protein